MMTHDEISRFFSEEDVKKAFQGWKIVKYVHIDELPIAKLYKPGQVIFAKREAVEWKRDLTMPTYEEWRNQMLGGLRPSDWDKFIVR